MDPQALHTIFHSTLDANPNTRMRAELDLRAVETQAGMLVAVLNIVASDQADAGVRQAAAM